MKLLLIGCNKTLHISQISNLIIDDVRPCDVWRHFQYSGVTRLTLTLEHQTVSEPFKSWEIVIQPKTGLQNKQRFHLSFSNEVKHV